MTAVGADPTDPVDYAMLADIAEEEGQALVVRPARRTTGKLAQVARAATVALAAISERDARVLAALVAGGQRVAAKDFLAARGLSRAAATRMEVAHA